MNTVTTPNETHLRAARAYREELEALHERMFAGQEPSRTDAERDALVDSIFIKHALPAASALTGGDADLCFDLAVVSNEAIAHGLTNAAAVTIRQAAARITALSAQVAELSAEAVSLLEIANRPVGSIGRIHQYDAKKCCEMMNEQSARIAELERDKARLLELLVDSDKTLDDIDTCSDAHRPMYSSYSKNVMELCVKGRKARRAAIDAAISNSQTKT